MHVVSVPGGVPIKAWVDGVEFEDEARVQLQNLAKMPFLFQHVAVMPDVHSGKGSTVGSVIATRGAIIPAACGVDIGCGMIAQKTSLRAQMLPEDLRGLRSRIEAAVPHGRSAHGGAGDVGAWDAAPQNVLDTFIEGLHAEYREIVADHPKLQHDAVTKQLGTLGTGNHFIEVCLDECGAVWVMLHSGSRGVGNRIGNYFIERAQKDMQRYFINLPDKDLAYLPEGSDNYDDYVKAVQWAQGYAFTNRQLMMNAVLEALEAEVRWPIYSGEAAVNCHHNYISEERHYGKNVIITRKGAVSAREGELGIIPGSMGAKSFIVRGKGNRESFHSCSHGAGRRMSRTKARATFSVEDHAAATYGVECKKGDDVLDETPGAYKSIDAVIAAESDLIEVVHTLKQVLCVKG